MNEQMNESTKGANENVRRRLLKGGIAGGAALGTGLMADKWAKPVINSVMMPAHAQMSPGMPPAGGGTGPIVQCNATQQAGGDTADTRSVDLGVTSGRFDFQYETFSIQDQMIVTYEGGVLFDTGCVGANGTETLSFSGSSTLVTVEVIPNCSGNTSGTAWNWQIDCPGS